MRQGRLLSVSADAKTVKGEKLGYLTGVLYLSPWKVSGRNLCPNASPGCILGCLNTSGKGGMTYVQDARLAKTLRFRENREAFMLDLAASIRLLAKKAAREGLIPIVRLNGTSDLPWQVTGVMDWFSEIQFYDYTKSFRKMVEFLDGKLPRNYYLTFSRSEINEAECLLVLARGGNVSVVFDTKKGEALPATWNGYRVIDGDESDVRIGDGRGVVVGLRAKGRAKKDVTGFVVRTNG